MGGIAYIIRCLTAADNLAARGLLGKRPLSSRPNISWVDCRRRNGNRKWNMLQKQEYLYDTMISSGEVVVESDGDGDVTEALIEALRLQWAFGYPYTPKGFPLLTHAFHSYPAGMQPATARHLMDTVLPGNSVLDPFVGGGTVVLEAMRSGRLGVGSDISPLALFVSQGRCWTASHSELDGLREASQSIADASRAKLGDAHTRRISGNDWEIVKAAISDYLAAENAGHGEGLGRALWFVFAVARSRAAKARHLRTDGRPPVVADRYFQSVCFAYARAVAELTTAASVAAGPSLPPAPLLIHRDARQPLWFSAFSSMEGCGKPSTSGDGEKKYDGRCATSAASEARPSASCDTVESRLAGCGKHREMREGLKNSAGELYGISTALRFDAVLTSPPYPGVYDYLGHARHARSRLGALPRPKPLGETSVLNSSREVSGIFGDDGICGKRSTSVFVDSPVPSGRDWPPYWTEGEIGAKAEARRQRRTAASSRGNAEPCRGVSITDGEAEVYGRALATKWAKDQRDWLIATARALRDGGGRMAIMVGDGNGVDTRLSLLEEVDAMARGREEVGLRVVGWATLRAAERAKRSMRTEHLILLEKS